MNLFLGFGVCWGWSGWTPASNGSVVLSFNQCHLRFRVENHFKGKLTFWILHHETFIAYLSHSKASVKPVFWIPWGVILSSKEVIKGKKKRRGEKRYGTQKREMVRNKPSIMWVITYMGEVNIPLGTHGIFKKKISMIL